MAHLNSSILFHIFRFVPVISIPSYMLAYFFITRNQSKIVKSVKKHYMTQMAINFSSVILMCFIVCPVMIPPIPGFFMTGIISLVDTNVALPLILITHVVLLVAHSLLQLFRHQLITLADLRFTKKYDFRVKIIRKCYIFCYLIMMIVALTIIPTFTLEFKEDGFRREAFNFFRKPVCYCQEMFIADPREWTIYVPYFASLSLGVACCVTGIISVVTCLSMIHDSRKIVSKETLIRQRNFSFILIYQASVCIIFIVVPLGTVSTLFYADLFISQNGLYYLLLISSQGSVNNLMHIVPPLWRKLFTKTSATPSRISTQRNSKMWSTSVSMITTSQFLNNSTRHNH